jgi:hypothetical protein
VEAVGKAFDPRTAKRCTLPTSRAVQLALFPSLANGQGIAYCETLIYVSAAVAASN